MLRLMGKRRPVGGELIAERLEAMGWSQSRLAVMFDVSDGTVSRWISGARVPSLRRAVEIAAVLGVDVADLVARRVAS